MARSLAGTRIRQRRRSLGLSQKDLAAKAEISASYLNLIEHNRRAIAGRVLNSLARELDIAIRELAEGPEATLIGTLQELSAGQGSGVENIEDLVARFPVWSKRLADLHEKSVQQSHTIEALGDRLTHDPYLSESLHLMLSSVTAIRSTASLMTSVDNMPQEQGKRFNHNIHTESLRLSDAIQSLVAYFDNSEDEQLLPVTPEEEFDRHWASIRPELAALDPDSDLSSLLADLKGPSHRLATAALEQYQSDAVALPSEPFLKHAAEVDYAPDQLAAWSGSDMLQVFRRLAALPTPIEFGLIEIDGAGHIKTRQPLPDFPLPRHGSGCAIWPLYQSLQQPGRPITTLLNLPGDKSFRCFALAQPKGTPAFGAARILEAGMLIRPSEAEPNAQAAGIVCKLCPRRDCLARSEPQIMAPPHGK